jgi:hypothetical protein
MNLKKKCYIVLFCQDRSYPQPRTRRWVSPTLISWQSIVLSGHDAADTAFAALADQQGKLPAPGKIPFMMQCLELIDTGRVARPIFTLQ